MKENLYDNAFLDITIETQLKHHISQHMVSLKSIMSESHFDSLVEDRLAVLLNSKSFIDSLDAHIKTVIEKYTKDCINTKIRDSFRKDIEPLIEARIKVLKGGI